MKHTLLLKMPSVCIIWTGVIERTLLKVLFNQANNSKHADNDFKKEAWSAAEATIQDLCPALTHEQAKNKVNNYKTKWKAWLKLEKQLRFR